MQPGGKTMLTKIPLSMTKFEGAIIGQQAALQAVIRAVSSHDKHMGGLIRNALEEAASAQDDDLAKQTIRSLID
jgi:hypothetical protein